MIVLSLVMSVGVWAATTPPSSPCAARDTSAHVRAAGQWAGWGADVANTRSQTAAAAGLSAAGVARLKLKWAFNLGDIIDARGQPTIAGGRVFVATPAGNAYAIDAASGCVHWTFTADGPLHGAVVVGSVGKDSRARSLAFFGDQKANAYAVDAATGTLVWQVHVDAHATARITGAPQLHDGVVYVPVSSYEEVMALAPKYECCSFRGSLVALDATTGKTIWKRYTIADSAAATTKSATGVQQRGPSGAPIWSTPTFDIRRNRLYVATGNNYSDPATRTSDAVIAIDAKTGTIVWTRQFTENDAANIGCDIPGKPMCPGADGPDADFGQAPILTTLAGGRRVLVVAQKSGMVHALDPDNDGRAIWDVRVARGGKLGGSQWGSAADARQMYVAISDVVVRGVPDSSAQGFHLEPDARTGGGLVALDLTTGKTRWHAAAALICGERKRCAPAQSAAITTIPGAVFSGSMDGHLRAYVTTTGAVIWDYDAAHEFETVNAKPARGGSFDVGGVAVANGMIFVSSGYGLWGGTPGNALLAFSVDGK